MKGSPDAIIAAFAANGMHPIDAAPAKPGKRARVQTYLPWPCVVPMPPSANNLFLNGHGKSRVKTPAYREWLAKVVPLMKKWVRPLSYPVCIQLKICGEIPANADVDNRIKSALDGMVAAGLIHKDNRKHVDEVNIRYVGDGVGMSITVIER